jgi:hypothetical protein
MLKSLAVYVCPVCGIVIFAQGRARSALRRAAAAVEAEESDKRMHDD